MPRHGRAVPDLGDAALDNTEHLDAADAKLAPHHLRRHVGPDMEGLVGDNPFTNEIVHFARCIRDGVEPISSGHDNLNTMEAVHGIYAAAEAGHTIEVADL